MSVSDTPEPKDEGTTPEVGVIGKALHFPGKKGVFGGEKIPDERRSRISRSCDRQSVGDVAFHRRATVAIGYVLFCRSPNTVPVCPIACKTRNG